MSELRIKHGYSLIWYGDLENYFKELTGIEWRLADAEDYPSQNTMIDCSIPDEEYSEDFDDDFDEEWRWSMQRWLDGGEYYNDPYTPGTPPRTGNILQWLHDNHGLPAGDYIVEVSW